MSETPQKNSRRSTRMLNMDADYKPSISVHVVNSPVVSKSAQTPVPQSPAFSTRSRVTITEKVSKLIDDLDSRLKSSNSKGSARKHPTIVSSGRMFRLDSPVSKLKLDEEKDQNFSQESVLALPISQSQEPALIKSPKIKRRLTTSSIMKALDETEKDTEDEEQKDTAAENDDDSNEESFDAAPSKEKADSSGDETNDYFSADEIERNKRDKLLFSSEKKKENQEGCEVSSIEEVDPVAEDIKLASYPYVRLEKIKVVEDTSSSEGNPPDTQVIETPKKKKKRKSASTPQSKTKKDIIQELVDSSLKVISMEISAVVSKKDESTGENTLTNIKITKGSPAKPVTAKRKSLSPTKPSPLQIHVNKISSAKKKDIQLKAMKNWSVTDTEGSETTESDDQPKQKKMSPLKQRSPSKSPEKSVKDEPTTPFKSPKKKLELQKSEVPSPEKKLKLNFDIPLESKPEETSSKEESSIEEEVVSDHAAEEVDEMEDDDGGLRDDDFEDDENEQLEDITDAADAEETAKANGAESDEDSDEAPEEVSMLSSKKTVSKIIQQEVEAIQHLSMAKKEKQLRREERKKEEGKQKKKLQKDARIELLPDSVLEQLHGKNVKQDFDGQVKEKKKKKKKKKNNRELVEDVIFKPKNVAISDDFISLKVDGPTKFGVMPLDGTSTLNFKEKNKWSHKYKADKYKRVTSKSAKKIKAKMESSSHSVPAGFKGDSHFY